MEKGDILTQCFFVYGSTCIRHKDNTRTMVDSMATGEKQTGGWCTQNTENTLKKIQKKGEKNKLWTQCCWGMKSYETIVTKTSYRVQSINCFMLDILCVYLNWKRMFFASFRSAVALILYVHEFPPFSARVLLSRW